MSMCEASVPALWPTRTVRWLVWLAYVLSWSTALLMPVPPVPEPLRNPEVHFIVAKTLHVVAYALLAILSGWLHLSGWRRWLLLAFLLAHGVVTEFLQWSLHALGRGGCKEDVYRDWAGIALGLVLSWKWWLRSND